jgi:IclR family KDG regulon transcriptional repressor
VELTGGQGESKARLSSVANAMRLLKAFSDEEYEIGISQLAKRLDLAKSTVHRLVTTLIEAGMLEQNPETGKYRLGLVVFERGSLVRRHMDFSREAKPYLMALRDKTNETVHLAIPEQSNILIINNLESGQAIRTTLNVGVRRPLHCTAEGKAMLAFKSPEEVAQLVGNRLPAYTAKTITDLSALHQALAVVRAQGYAVDDEESAEGLRCVAAPIRNHSGNVVAATSVAGPSQRLSREKLSSCAGEVVAAAQAISLRLGYYAFQAAEKQA